MIARSFGVRGTLKVTPYIKWLWSRSWDYLQLQRQNQLCVCCGHISTEWDHIVSIDYELGPKGRTKAPYRQAYQLIKQLESGNLQPICRTCNLSKGDSFFCHIHSKYLGIWNYLPELTNIE